MTAKYFF